jgi:hypothetical protein
MELLFFGNPITFPIKALIRPRPFFAREVHAKEHEVVGVFGKIVLMAFHN